MATVEVRCPTCNGIQVYKYGKSKNGTPKYPCHAQYCPRKTFRLEYRYEGAKRVVHQYSPQDIVQFSIGGLLGINEKVIAMAANASGIRDTARVLKISTDKVMDTSKKLKLR